MSDFEKGMKIRGELEAANQAHLLQFYEALDQDRKEELEADLKSLEIDKLGDMFKGFIFYHIGPLKNFIDLSCTSLHPTRCKQIEFCCRRSYGKIIRS